MSDEVRDTVPLTNLDQPLFDGAGATKRDLVEYLDGVRDRIIPALEDRPLSVIRVHRGQEAFMPSTLCSASAGTSNRLHCPLPHHDSLAIATLPTGGRFPDRLTPTR